MPAKRNKKPNVITRPPQQLVGAHPPVVATRAAVPPGLIESSFTDVPSSSAAAASSSSSAAAPAVPPKELTSAIPLPEDPERQVESEAVQGDPEVDPNSWLSWWSGVGEDARSYLERIGESVAAVTVECFEDLVEEISKKLVGTDIEMPCLVWTNASGVAWVAGASSCAGFIYHCANVAIPSVAVMSLGSGCVVWGLASLGFIYVQVSMHRQINIRQVVNYQAVVLGIYAGVGWLPILSSFGVITGLVHVAKCLILVDSGVLIYLSQQHFLTVQDIRRGLNKGRTDDELIRYSNMACMTNTCLWTFFFLAIHP